MLVVLWTVLMVMSILVIHEAGHFVMALLVRLPVRSLHLGIPLGPQIRTKLGKYPFTISLLPFGMAVIIDEEMMWRIPLSRRVLVFIRRRATPCTLSGLEVHLTRMQCQEFVHPFGIAAGGLRGRPV